MRKTKKEKKERLVGYDAVPPWTLASPLRGDARIAWILAEAKRESRVFCDLPEEIQEEIADHLDLVKVIEHFNNGRERRFSVIAPKELIDFLREKNIE